MISITLSSNGFNPRWGQCPFDEALTTTVRLLHAAAPDTKIIKLTETELVIIDSRDPFIELYEAIPDEPQTWRYRFWHIGGELPEAFNALSTSIIGYVLLHPTLASDEVKSFVQARLDAQRA